MRNVMMTMRWETKHVGLLMMTMRWETKHVGLLNMSMLLDISINIRILYRHRLQQRERKMEKNTLSKIKVTRIEASVGEMCLMVKCL